MMSRLLAALVAFAGSTALARADDPMPKEVPVPLEIVPKEVPFPLEIVPRTLVPAQVGSPFRFGTRDVWQNYGVDSAGRWRPIVYRAPSFSTSYFYLYNGHEYPWATTRPLDFMPYSSD